MPRRNLYELNYGRIEALLQRPLAELQPEDVIRLQANGLSSRLGGVAAPGPL